MRIIHLMLGLLRALAAAALILQTSVCTAADAPGKPFLIVAAMAPTPENLGPVETLRGAVARSLAPREVVFRNLGIAEMSKLTEKGIPDAVIARPFYGSLNEYRDIGTFLLPGQKDPMFVQGSTVIVRKDRADLRGYRDLKGKHVVANDPGGFQGMMAVLYEIYKLGYDPDSFFGKVTYVGTDLAPAVEMVRNGRADAALMPVCFLESLAAKGVDTGAFRVIDKRKQDKLSCAVSSSLYPGRCMLLSGRVDLETTHRVMLAVHSLRRDRDGIELGLSGNYREVDQMYRSLKRGAYEEFRHWSFKRFWTEYRQWCYALILLIALLAAHSLRARYLVRSRTRMLEASLREQKAMSGEINALNQRVEQSKRAATVSQFSSLVAHELSQPLAGIVLYSDGLKSDLAEIGERAGCSLAGPISVADKILARARKAHLIVNRVRDFARSGRQPPARIDLAAFVRDAVSKFILSEELPPGLVSLDIRLRDAFVMASTFDLEVVLFNLLRNSRQAVEKQRHPKISVALGLDSSQYCLTVEDSGPAIDDSLIQRLGEPLTTSKPEGIGLGLSIVRSVMENHLGHTRFSRSAGGGLRVDLLFPSCGETSI